MGKIKVVFFATPDIALKTFEYLINSDEFDVCCLVTQSPKPKGRGNKITDSLIKKSVIENNIDLIESEKISKDEIAIKKLKSYGADFFVTFAYGQILSQEILDIPKIATVNIHPSLLPKYRGSNPIRTCLLNGDKETGITTAITVFGLDEGDIALSEKIELDKNTDYEELKEIISKKAPLLLEKTLKGLKDNTIIPKPQNPNLASYTSKTKKEDKYLDFGDNAYNLHNRIRALKGDYTCHAMYKGKIIKILKSTFVKNSKEAKTAEVLSVDKKGILVKCKDNAILLETLKPEGKKEMTAWAWTLGSKIKEGDLFQ